MATRLRTLSIGFAALALTISANAMTTEFKITASDAAGSDLFGTAVSVSGDTLIASGMGNDDGASNAGAAYIFVRSGSMWIEQQKLTASDPSAQAFFGQSAAIAGETAVVGARAGNVGTGSAYVFVRSGTTWTQQQKLTASDGASSDYFGYSIAISGDGDTVVVGAKWNDAIASQAGTAYVFVRSGTTWTEQQKLTASDAAADDQFGESVTISGDTILVGAARDDDNGADSGSAYVFVRSGTTWTQQQKLTASDAAAGQYFGISASVSGETAIVGADLDLNLSGSGSAYVFVRSGVTWTQQQKLTPSDPDAGGGGFGGAVSLDGETAAIGSRSHDHAGISSSGSVYVFGRSGVTWTQQEELTASDADVSNFFGRAVSTENGTVVVGASLANNGGLFDSGSTYIYDLAVGVPGDTDGNGIVNVDDLINIILLWGTVGTNPCCPGVDADVNGSGNVDVDDLVAVILGWS